MKVIAKSEPSAWLRLVHVASASIAEKATAYELDASMIAFSGRLGTTRGTLYPVVLGTKVHVARFAASSSPCQVKLACVAVHLASKFNCIIADACLQGS